MSLRKLEQGLERVGGMVTKRHKETAGDDGYAHYLDYGDSFTGANMSKD